MAATNRGIKSGKTITLNDEDGRISIGRRLTYVVIADAVDEPEINILLSGVPIASVTVLDGLACKSTSARQDPKQPRVWYVDCDFASQPTQEQDSEAEDPNDPTTWRPIWKGVPSWAEKFSANDADGVAVTNPAGDKFSEPISSLEPIVSHVFTQYEDPALTIADITERHNSVNDDTFRGFQKWTLKLLVKEFEKYELLGFECWKIDYECQLRYGDPANSWYKKVAGVWTHQTTLTSGWHEMRLAMGPRYLNGDGNPIQFKDAEGRTKQGMLEADGTERTSGDPLVLGIPVCKELDFSFIRSA